MTLSNIGFSSIKTRFIACYYNITSIHLYSGTYTISVELKSILVPDTLLYVYVSLQVILC